MNKQPTATAFTRSQESWSEFVLNKVRTQIADREEWLAERGIEPEDFDTDDELLDLYDDEIFWIRYGKQMAKQREFLREKYLGG